MKICGFCRELFDSKDWRCPGCKEEPIRLGPFLSFAPDLAQDNPGFKPEFFQNLAKLEGQNFWFRARNKLIVATLLKFFPNAKKFFEIGCGTGLVLSGIKQACPQLDLRGSEIFCKGLEYASERLNKVELFQMDARRIPFSNEFDVIGAFDVLEHIVEDQLVLGEMHKALRPGGGLIVTVPQHQFLWGPADDHACHVRRYSAAEIKEKLERGGFILERLTSFVSFLFPLMVASRLWQKRSKGDFNELAELQISGWKNAVLEKVLDFERWLIRRGLNFPFGGSLLVVAKKV